MKKSLLLACIPILLFLFSSTCSAQEEVLEISDDEKVIFKNGLEEAVKIADEKTEYEITIIEPGFNTWLQSIARPEGYYSQSFLENRNRLLVINWNNRVNQPQRFDPNLYQIKINYSSTIDYGYDVNYKLYNYFIFFQRRFNERLSGFIPRI